jgi:hypothetical protein
MALAAIAATWIVFSCSTANSQSPSNLAVRVSPEAELAVTRLGSDSDPRSGVLVELLQLTLTIRLNTGATASLWVQSPSESSGVTDGNRKVQVCSGSTGAAVSCFTPTDSPHIVFTARMSGRYSVRIGVKTSGTVESPATAEQKLRVELNSSDGVVHITKSL